MLIAPAFGIGSELSATGPNGPSIFPSTAMGVRLRYQSAKGGYVEAAIFNAESGVIGDSGRVPPLFGKGALLIAEAGHARDGIDKFGFGAWTYTNAQPDLRRLDGDGKPVPQRSWGVYAIYETRVAGSAERGLSLFARVGVSDGATTPYRGGWQAGLLAIAPFASRPEGQLSIGVNQAFMTNRFIRNLTDEGETSHRQETGVELTYADKLAPWLTVQPDVQYVRNATYGPKGCDTLAFTLRLRFTLPKN